jgi:hypothetical protein
VSRALAAVLLAALLLAGCGGGDAVDPQVAQLRLAERTLEGRPADPRALADLIRAAHAVMESRTDKISGLVDPGARPLLAPVAAAWRRYVDVTGDRADPSVVGLATAILDRGLGRPGEAAQAMLAFTAERPSAAAYLRLMDLYLRAGNTRQAMLAGRKAVALAKPGERRQVRATVRQYLSTAP